MTSTTSAYDASPPAVDAFPRPVSGVDHEDSPNAADLVNGHSDSIEALERRVSTIGLYTPTIRLNNTQTAAPSTWAGVYTDHGYYGDLTLEGHVTGAWTGGDASAFVSIPLPPGWTAGGIDSVLDAYFIQMPTFGFHNEFTGVVHGGADEVRLISTQSKPLYVDVAPIGYMTATASTDLFATPGLHGLSAGDPVYVGAIGSSLPGGVTIGQRFVLASGLTTSACKLSTTVGGSAIDVTSDGTVFVTKQALTPNMQRDSWVVDGVLTPFQFTGDGTLGNQDLIRISGRVLKGLS